SSVQVVAVLAQRTPCGESRRILWRDRTTFTARRRTSPPAPSRACRSRAGESVTGIRRQFPSRLRYAIVFSTSMRRLGAALLPMQRVVTDEPTAVAIYSVRSGSLVLEFAYSTTGSDAHFRSYDDESGFTEYSWYADTQPTGASKVIRTWSLNGPFTDYFAEVL